MTTAIVTGVFTLFGVIVGGLVTGAVDLHAQRKKRDAAIFQARRLVGQELSLIAIHLDGLIGRGKAPRRTGLAEQGLMPTTEWEAHKETLAQEDAASDDVWEALSIVLQAAGRLRLMVLELEPGSPLPPDLQGHVHEQREQVAVLYRMFMGKPLEV